MKIWTPCTTFLWHLKWTTQKRPVGLKKYVKILSLMLCIWFSNGKTMTRFITISQSEQKKRLHGKESAGKREWPICDWLKFCI